MRLPLIFLLGICFISSTAYGFDVFDANRGKPPVVTLPPVTTTPVKSVNPPPPPKPPAPPPPPPPPQRDFTLRGTSLIGGKRLAILQSPDGKDFIQRFREGRTAIEGFPEYALLTVNSRQVTIEYPANSPCRADNPQKGVKCRDGGKTALLELAKRDAIAAPPPPVAPPPPPVPTVAQAQQPQNQPPNPFVQQPQKPLTPEEYAKREEERKKREELYKNFQRQVIKEEDVPPGMRVIRTPFGDRLVPADK